MFNGNWRFLGLFAGLAALVTAFGLGAYSIGLAYSHGEEQCTDAATNGPQTEERCPQQIDTNRSGLPYLAESVASNPEPKDTQERERRDLAAQESMAVWAFWMMAASMIGIVITAIGTSLLLWQIILTSKAVADTGNATEAMREANEIARSTSQAQLRAYLDFDEVSFCSSAAVPDTETDKGTGVRIQINNFGATPARQVIVKFQCKICNADGEPYAQAGEKTMEFSGIAPGDHAIGRSLFSISKEVWQNLDPKGLRIFVPTRVSYVDVFGNPHHLTSTFVSSTNDDVFGFYAGSRSMS